MKLLKKTLNTTLILIVFSTSILLGQKPNVVFILADDLGWKDLSCQGSEVYETPNIDKLAKSGMKFQQAYTAHPRCAPARYAFITGRYPARVHLPGNWKWDGSEYTFAQAFHDAGYKTFFAGKWHIAKGEVYPQDVGFDINIGGGHAGAPQSYFYPYNVKSKGKGNKKDIKGLEDGKKGEYLPDRLTDETIKFIKANKDKPFFVYLSHYSVHTPFEAKEEYVKYYREKIKNIKFEGKEFIKEGTGYTKCWQNNPVYAAMIQSLDESVGRVLTTLEELDLSDNTIVVFTSDHGGLSNKGYNYRPLATSNLPLRAGKGHCYEGGLRIPFIIRWPGITEAGSESYYPVIGVDFYPTLVEAAGIKMKYQTEIDGKSFVPAIKGIIEENKNRTMFWHSPLARPYSTGDINVTVVRQGDYKLLDFYDARKKELYYIPEDIGEHHNLINEEPEIAERLYKKIINWRKDVNAYVDKNNGKKK